MTQLKSFFFNGQQYYTTSEISLLDLILYFNYNTSLIVLEYNNFICNKNYWDNIYLKTDDKIEMVTIVGGG